MKTYTSLKTIIAIGFLLSGVGLSITGNAPAKYQSSGAVKFVIEGTSNIHDWEMKPLSAAELRKFLNAGFIMSLTD